MSEDELERRLDEIKNKLAAFSESLEPGDGLSHVEVIESGCLADDDVQFLIESGVKVEVARRAEGEPWVHIERPDGRTSTRVVGSEPPTPESAHLARKDFSAFIHRVILEGRNPTITVELSDGHTLVFGIFDGKPSGVMTIFGPNTLSVARRLSFRAMMESRAREVFDGVQDGHGHWNYTYRVLNRQQAACAEEIVFELFEMTEPVEVKWSENIFAR
jgi:hypothetical protein